MSNSELTIHGRLTRKPEVIFGKSGTAVMNTSVAYNDRIKNKDTGEWSDGPATFLNIVAFGQMAEAVIEYGLDKGDLVIASGELKMDTYEKDGEKKTSYKMYLSDIGPSLKWLNKKQQNKTGTTVKEDYSDDVPFL